MSTTSATRRPRFTLIELLVVIAIISILASMLLPALMRARAQAIDTYCMNNRRTVAMGLLLYANDNDDILPRQLPNADNVFGRFIELKECGNRQLDLFRVFHGYLDIGSAPNIPYTSGVDDSWNFVRRPPPVLRCAADGRTVPASSSPFGVLGVFCGSNVEKNASLPGKRGHVMRIARADRAAKVLGVGSAALVGCTVLGRGKALTHNRGGTHYLQSLGGNVAHVDGSARWYAALPFAGESTLSDWRGYYKLRSTSDATAYPVSMVSYMAYSDDTDLLALLGWLRLNGSNARVKEVGLN